MSLKEFGFDIKDIRMRWGGWVFLRKIKMSISNFFNEKMYSLLSHRRSAIHRENSGSNPACCKQMVVG